MPKLYYLKTSTLLLLFLAISTLCFFPLNIRSFSIYYSSYSPNFLLESKDKDPLYFDDKTYDYSSSYFFYMFSLSRIFRAGKTASWVFSDMFSVTTFWACPGFLGTLKIWFYLLLNYYVLLYLDSNFFKCLIFYSFLLFIYRFIMLRNISASESFVTKSLIGSHKTYWHVSPSSVAVLSDYFSSKLMVF